MRMSATLFTKLVTVEELLITNQFESDKSWQLPEDPISWRRFLIQFRSAKILEVQHKLVPDIALHLQSEWGESGLDHLPAWEKFELRWYTVSESKHVSRLGVLQPFLSARQRAGRPVKVCHSCQRERWSFQIHQSDH